MALQLSHRNATLHHQQFTLVKPLCDLRARAITYTLTPQRSERGESEVIQQVLPDSGVTFVLAFSSGAIVSMPRLATQAN
jgi:hypothetical protein